MPTGWKECIGQTDKDLLCALIEYNSKEEPPSLDENETLYRVPPERGVQTRLLWCDQHPVGFYILRLKGPQDDGLPLHLNVIDGIFIKKAHRRKGWGYKMLVDVVSQHPNKDLGFSHPISKSLKFVIVKFLLENPQYRDKFWAIQNCGEEGDRLNIWLSRNN